MALTDIVPKLHAAAFLQPFFQDNIWSGILRDRTSELPYGDTLELPLDDTDYDAHITDKSTDAQGTSNWGPGQTAYAQLARPAPTMVDASKVMLRLDTIKTTSHIVSPTLEAVTRPSFLVNVVMREARAFAKDFNTKLRSTVAAGVNTLPGITVAKGNEMTTSTTDQDNFINKIIEAALVADGQYWPNAGRVCVVSPTVYYTILNGLLRRNYFVQRGINENILVSAMLPNVYGWDIVKDNSAGAGVTASDGGSHRMFFLLRGIGTSWARRFLNARVYNSLTHFGVVSEMDVYYGVAVDEPAKGRTVPVTISA